MFGALEDLVMMFEVLKVGLRGEPGPQWEEEEDVESSHQATQVSQLALSE